MKFLAKNLFSQFTIYIMNSENRQVM